tara:strand:- start:75 stop:671 length:597 start_codon:yes stop_codon:yes gene_type:complete
MCSIFGSYYVGEFNELAELNSHRGNHSFSTAMYDGKSLEIIDKSLGKFELSETRSGSLHVGHVQAPTTSEKTISSVHPSELDETLLWHNGIIKEEQLKKWNYHSNWDTACLHKHIVSNMLKLSEVDGSFACIYFKEETLYMWRNENCPMFVRGASFSSVNFKGADKIDANVIYKLENKKWVKTNNKFNTNKTFFWTPG